MNTYTSITKILRSSKLTFPKLLWPSVHSLTAAYFSFTAIIFLCYSIIFNCFVSNLFYCTVSNEHTDHLVESKCVAGLLEIWGWEGDWDSGNFTCPEKERKRCFTPVFFEDVVSLRLSRLIHALPQFRSHDVNMRVNETRLKLQIKI